MMKVTIFVVVLALVYCTEAQPNLFNMFNLDPEKMQADMMKQMKTMMDPNYLKNQNRDGQVVFSTASLVNGKPAYEVYLAKNKDGVFSDYRHKGPE